MSLAPIIAKLYPVALALANAIVGVGGLATDAPVLAALMWVSGALVLIGFVSSVTPVVIRRLHHREVLSDAHTG